MSGASPIEHVESVCAEQGLRLTPIRRRVLELIIQADAPIKAYDLLDQLKKERPGAAPPTIYRALEFLLAHHFIHRIETLNAYVSCMHPEHPHEGQFLICNRCHQVVEIEDSVLNERLLKAAASEGFTPSHQVLEIYGCCDDCETVPARAKPNG